MIFGNYPCCEGDLCIDMPDKSPVYASEDCPHCGAKVWHRLSRIQPTSWTEEDFLKEFDVDHEKKTIRPKPGSEAEAFDKRNAELFKAHEDGIISLDEAMACAISGTSLSDYKGGV